MYGAEEVACSLVVARGDGTELLEFGEEILDQVARLEQVSVIVAGRYLRGCCLEVGLRRSCRRRGVDR